MCWSELVLQELGKIAGTSAALCLPIPACLRTNHQISGFAAEREKNIPKFFLCMRRLLRREHYCAENVLEGSLISTDLVLALALVRHRRPAAAGCGGVGRSEPPRVIF